MEENIKQPKTYEMSFLVADEGEVAGVVDLVKKFSGTVLKDPTVRRIALAYPIKKQTSAVFGFFHFQAPGEQVKALEQEIRVTGFIVRSMIIAVKEKKERTDKAGEKPRVARPATLPREGAEKKVSTSATLSNEALTKKIEEILQ